MNPSPFAFFRPLLSYAPVRILPRIRLASPGRLIGLLAVLLIGVLTSAASVFAQGAERPNIVFIFSDDHATQALGAYGGPLAALDPTPNLDRLADETARLRAELVRLKVQYEVPAP